MTIQNLWKKNLFYLMQRKLKRYLEKPLKKTTLNLLKVSAQKSKASSTILALKPGKHLQKAPRINVKKCWILEESVIVSTIPPHGQCRQRWPTRGIGNNCLNGRKSIGPVNTNELRPTCLSITFHWLLPI